MRVCDHCSKSGELSTIHLKNKSYDLCDSCLNRIITFLNSKEKENPIGKLLGGFQQ